MAVAAGRRADHRMSVMRRCPGNRMVLLRPPMTLAALELAFRAASVALLVVLAASLLTWRV
jgi:hypothetical protein